MPSRRPLPSPVRRWCALLPLLVLPAACGSAEEGGSDESDLNGSAYFTLAPDSEALRVSCRAASLVRYCSDAEARRAADACKGSASATAITIERRQGDRTCVRGAPLYATVDAFAENSAPSPASRTDACRTPLPYHCGFYARCVDGVLPCGDGGYALGFGEKFCTAFRGTALSPRGQAWMRSTMLCLQRALIPAESTSGFSSATGTPARGSAREAACTTLFDRAFASHPGCYTAPENSICTLPASDLAAISATIGLRELLQVRTGSQVAATAVLCLKQLFRPDAPRPTPAGVPAPSAPTADDPFAPQRAFWEAELARSQGPQTQ